MKSYLIKDTTKQERIELIRQWVPADEAMEDCEIDLWDMYHDYIEGKREIAEINAAFVEGEQGRKNVFLMELNKELVEPLVFKMGGFIYELIYLRGKDGT